LSAAHTASAPSRSYISIHTSGHTSKQLPQAIHFSGHTTFEGWEPEEFGSVSGSKIFKGQARTHKKQPLHNSRSMTTFPFLAMDTPLSTVMLPKSGIKRYGGIGGEKL
jgi:hypothetical protein